MKRSLLAILAVLSLSAAMPTAGAVETPTPTAFLTTAGPATTIIGEYPLTGGRLLVNFTMPGRNGWALVLPGTQIGQEPLSLGEGRETLTVRPPEPGSGVEARLAAQQLAASGWTEAVQVVLLDLVGSGTPPATAIAQVEPQRSSAATEDPNPDKDHFADDCIIIDNPDEEVRAQGCYNRYWGQEDDYEAFTGSTSWAFAAVDSSELALTIVTTAHSYGNATMRQYSPLSPIEQGSCSNVTLGLSSHGVSVSQSQQICPEKLFPTILEGGTVYGVDWRGAASGEQRHTELVEIARTVKGYAPASGPAHFGFAYHMDFATQSRCSVRPNDCIFDPVDLIGDMIEDVLH